MDGLCGVRHCDEEPPPVTIFQRRLFIFADEWLGVALCCWCWHVHREVFWPVLIAWAIAIYVFGYIPYWMRWDRWWA